MLIELGRRSRLSKGSFIYCKWIFKSPVTTLILYSFIVVIYRLISSNTVEERVLARARQKMVLDALVIKKRGSDGLSDGLADVLVDDDAEGEEDMAKMGVDELWKLLSAGVEKVFDPSVEETEDLTAMEADQLIASAQPAKWDDNTGDDNATASEDPTDLSKLDGTIFTKKKVGRPKKAETIDLLSSSNDESSVPGAVDTSFSDSEEEIMSEDKKKRRAYYEPVAVSSEIVDGVRRTKRMKKAPTKFVANYFENNGPKKAKIIHDSNCFCCQKFVVKPPKANGKNDKALAVSKAGLECIACPRVYHMKCVGLTRRPKTKSWYCPWHCCSSCERKKTDAGGTLL